MRDLLSLMLSAAELSCVSGDMHSEAAMASLDQTSPAQVVADMRLPNEGVPIDPQFDWAFHPKITMRSPRGDAIPAWWKGDRPAWTNAILSWFIVLEGQGNAASNSSVEVRDLLLFIYSKRDAKWWQVDAAAAPAASLWEYPFRRVADGTEQPDIAAGTTSIFTPRYPHFHHGWGNARGIDAPDVGAVFAVMKFRLSLPDPGRPDDRHRAKYLVGVGADYYPDMRLRWSLDFAPGVGSGRLLLAAHEWRTASFIVLNLDGGAEENRAITALPMTSFSQPPAR